MWKPTYSTIHSLYRTYREWIDVRRMRKRYPERAEYENLCYEIENDCDVEVYQAASYLCDATGANINQVITHIKSLMYRYYYNNISTLKCNGMYTQHYYDADKKLWMYRDGTIHDVIRPADLTHDVGAPLLNDIPPGRQGEWLLPI